MEIYTIKETSRKTKIGAETLKRAIEEGLIKAKRLANVQYPLYRVLDIYVAEFRM